MQKPTVADPAEVFCKGRLLPIPQLKGTFCLRTAWLVAAEAAGAALWGAMPSSGSFMAFLDHDPVVIKASISIPVSISI